MRMLSLYIRILNLTDVNAMLHYFSKIPFLGGLVGPRVFRSQRFKHLLSALGACYRFLRDAIGRTVGIYLFVVTAAGWLMRGRSPEEMQALRMSVYLLVFCVLPVITGARLFSGTREDHMFLEHFMMPPNRYYRMKAMRILLKELVIPLPVLWWIFRTPQAVLLATGANILASALAECLYLGLYAKKGKLIARWKRMMVSGALKIAVLVFLYIGWLPRCRPTMASALAVCAGGAVAVLFEAATILRFRRFKEIAVRFANADATAAQVVFGTTISEEDRGICHDAPEEAKAYALAHAEDAPLAYLDGVFRHRFSKILRNLVLKQLRQSAILMLAVAAAIRLDILVLHRPALSYTPFLLTFVYALPRAQSYLSILFRNIDRVFLANHLYRPEDVRRLMARRTMHLFGMSIPMLLGFFAMLYLFNWVAALGLSAGTIARLMIPYALLYYFYDLLQVATYFGIQPYSTELTVKSPVFTVLGILLSALQASFLFIRANILENIPQIAAALGVMILLWGIVYCYSPRWFRLRF